AAGCSRSRSRPPSRSPLPCAGASMQLFDHERLEVYGMALEFLVLADEVAEILIPGRGPLADQLRRAATSIILNIAEGAGEFSRKEKARFYRMALRSATESAAILGACRVLKVVPPNRLLAGREMLLRIVG